ncbi:hypothetical protein [Saccharothrix texasensis]|uniref:Uncharacterized protein n=1 Tax=Saccharothrix texasensis TaxID=103734 RepID=A0A3N1H6D2_9PSEU|nr:hypothetical protein [Saccharothrix texasensis]ROP38048.1 hypothetical protein EDD40_3386 [Saccharothrix texasensis]
MTEPVVRWTSGPDRLADVVVREVPVVEGRDPTAAMLRDNPFAALAVAVSTNRIVVRTEAGLVVELAPVATGADCLDVEAVVLSAVHSLYAWHVARLDLRALRARGLPVWCADHRARRSAAVCGWLRAVVHVQPLSDAVGL